MAVSGQGRRYFLLGGGSVMLAGLAGCQTEMVLAPIESGYSIDVTSTVLPLINALRAKHDKAPLHADPIALNAAMDHAIRMARAGKMSHDLGPDASYLDRMKRLGVTLPAAENIAVGQKTAEKAFDAWARSKHHLDNMIGDFKGLGVALAYQSERNNRPFWAMELSNLPAPFPSRVRFRAARTAG